MATALFKIATLNIGRGGSRADLQDLASRGATVICMQEMADRNGMDPPNGWNWWWPNNAVNVDENPICYDPAVFNFRDGNSHFVSKNTYVGDSGAGGDHMHPKYIQRVSLFHQPTKQLFHVMNSHTVPSVEGGGGHPGSHSKRNALYRKHIAHQNYMIGYWKGHRSPEGLYGFLFICGDWNVNYAKDRQTRNAMFPYRNWSKRNIHASYRDLGLPGNATFGNRHIDYVAHNHRAGIACVDQSVVPGGSDHHALLVTYRVRIVGT